jgi:hypothetical protein
VPSRGCPPEGPKYGKEAYFGYSWRHQAYNSRHGFHSCCSKNYKNYVQHCIYFYTFLQTNFQEKTILKIVTKLVYISELLSTFVVIFFSLCSLLCGKNQYCIEL